MQVGWEAAGGPIHYYFDLPVAAVAETGSTTIGVAQDEVVFVEGAMPGDDLIDATKGALPAMSLDQARL